MMMMMMMMTKKKKKKKCQDMREKSEEIELPIPLKTFKDDNQNMPQGPPRPIIGNTFISHVFPACKSLDVSSLSHRFLCLYPKIRSES
jgi:hypothetical protein